MVRSRGSLFRAALAMLLATLATLTLLAGRAALAYTPPPIQGHITDTAGVLSADQRAELERQLEEVRRRSGDEIAVLIIPSLGDEPIEDIAYTTFNTWKIGQRGADNGVLLVLAPAERRVRIETGKGVGGALTDLQANDIIRTELAPLLRDGRTFDAITAGTHAIEVALGKEQAGKKPPPTERPRPRSRAGWLVLLSPLLLFYLLLRSRGRGGGGGFGGPYGGFPGGGGGGWGGGESGGGGGYQGGGGESGGGGSSGSY